jgi:hypothetical protein
MTSHPQSIILLVSLVFLLPSDNWIVPCSPCRVQLAVTRQDTPPGHVTLIHQPLPQSRQSAKRFSSRWNWDSPTPLAAGECAPPPFGPGGGQTR